MIDQKGPFPAGTAVSLKIGGPIMTVENLRRDGLVSTVWFFEGICHRDTFDAVSLNAWAPLEAKS